MNRRYGCSTHTSTVAAFTSIELSPIAARKMVGKEQEAIDADITELTGGRITTVNQVARMQTFVCERGHQFTSLEQAFGRGAARARSRQKMSGNCSSYVATADEPPRTNSILSWPDLTATIDCAARCAFMARRPDAGPALGSNRKT